MHVVPAVLSPEALASLRARLASARWGDGRSSAGPLNARVKRNLELDAGDQPDPLQREIVEALDRNAAFRSAALPRRYTVPIVSRYLPGMAYGRHVDNAFQRGPQLLRADVSVTVFLSDPEAYAGGELVVATPAGEAAFKLPAGSALVYPASTEHWVEPVTEGERLVAVLWAESLVPDPRAREILHDLQLVVARLGESAPDAVETRLAQKAHANLLRLLGSS